jgi:hypothetical protein
MIRDRITFNFFHFLFFRLTFINYVAEAITSTVCYTILVLVSLFT